MIDKRAALGEGIFMIYRLLLVSFIAFTIFGVSSVFYDHYIDVRDAEAVILTREVVNCISSNAVVDPSSFSETDKTSILSYCGFESLESERFFVKATVEDFKGDKVLELSQGDSGKLWVRNFFENNVVGDQIGKYFPGSFSSEYLLYIIQDSYKIEGILKVEVIVGDEF